MIICLSVFGAGRFVWGIARVYRRAERFEHRLIPWVRKRCGGGYILRSNVWFGQESGPAASGTMGWITTSGLIGYLKAIHITPIMEALSVMHEAGIAKNAYSAFEGFLTDSVKNPALACSKIISISRGSHS